METLPLDHCLSDINHPRDLLVRWRGEAAMLRKMIEDNEDNPDLNMDGVRGRGATLMQCADELENRLLWSGL